MKTLSSNCFLSLLCTLLSVIYIVSHQPFLSIIPLFTNCEYPKTFSIFAVSIQKQMDTVKIDIELPSCGYYSKEELTDLIYSYALSLVLPDSVSDMSVEDELKELKRRAAEMDSNPSVCIPHEEVYERVMSRLHRYENHLA